MRHRCDLAVGLLLVCLVGVLPAGAQEAAAAPGDQDLRQTVEQLQKNQGELLELVKSLQAEIARLKEAPAAAVAESAATGEPSLDELLNPTAPAVPEDVESATTRGAAGLNPDISVVGDFVVNLGDKHPELGTGRHDTLNRHIELALSQRVIPQARAVVKLAYGTHQEVAAHEHQGASVAQDDDDHEHGASVWHAELELEEAYLQFDQLVDAVQIRLGRERVPVMFYNQLDGHELPFVNPPLALARTFGSHGLIEDGVRVSWLLPTRQYANLDLGVYNSRNDSAFDGGASGDRLWFGRLNGYTTWSDDRDELSWSLAALKGAGDDEGSPSRVYAMDLRYQHLWDSFTRLYADVGYLQTDLEREGESFKRDGYYMHLARRWDRYRRNQVGLLWEQADGLHHDGPEPYKQISAYYTWHLNERVMFRVQYSHTDLGEEKGNTVFFQTSWVGGTHPAHD